MTLPNVGKDGRPHKRCPEFLCHIKFKNTLPEPMIDFRLAAEDKVDWTSFTGYYLNSLERNHQPVIPTDFLQLPLLDTVDLSQWTREPDAIQSLDSEDREVFLQETIPTSAKRSTSGPVSTFTAAAATTTTTANTIIPTDASNLPSNNIYKKDGEFDVRKTTIISTRRNNEAEEGTTLVDQLLQTIEDSFSPLDYKTIVHPTKRGLRPVAIHPVIPSTFVADAESLALCTFDSNPMPSAGKIDGIELAKDGDRKALMQGMSNADNPQDSFVWFYLPQEPKSKFDGELESQLEESKLADKSPKMVFTREYDIQRSATLQQQQQQYMVLHLPPEENAYAPAQYSLIQGNFSLKKRRLNLSTKDNSHSLTINRIHQ